MDAVTSASAIGRPSTSCTSTNTVAVATASLALTSDAASTAFFRAIGLPLDHYIIVVVK